LRPRDLQWQAYLEFADEGYVKDDEKIDAPALLKTLKENNRERQCRAAAPRVGRLCTWWIGPHRLSTHGHQAVGVGDDSRVAGRAGGQLLDQDPGKKGLYLVIMATDPANLSAAEGSLDNVLTGYAFNPGETYADWRSGDKVAKYGLAALIVGGVAAVAAKKGLFSVLAGFLAVAWKFIAAAAVAALAWLRRLFTKKAT